MRRFGPLPEGYAAIGDPCPACGRPFAAGDYVALIPTAPADPEEAARAEAGLEYTSEAALVHWECRERASLPGGLAWG
jgi:hypothetical protein